ncbi:unnamed protein product [Acanthoscelides obtectus]|uniref:Uncharacterized protein n=1 Tax=Acanthoscelides obtectus TaxID=200917 RepID=A0A9P0LBC5_ACAOB|nr:unnamed protein product [Acanthoscelides obtectus]
MQYSQIQKTKEKERNL